jgi:hypothetical protein
MQAFQEMTLAFKIILGDKVWEQLLGILVRKKTLSL